MSPGTLFGSLHDVELRGFTGDPYSQIRWYEDDFQGNASTTGQISLGETKAGTIEVDQDTDWFSITLEQGKAYDFDVRGATDGGGTLRDPYVALYNSEGEYINRRLRRSGVHRCKDRARITWR